MLIPALLKTNVLGKYMASRARAVHPKLTEVGATSEPPIEFPPVEMIQGVAEYDEAEWQAFKSDFSEVLDIGRAARPLLELLSVPDGISLAVFDGMVSIAKSEVDAFLA